MKDLKGASLADRLAAAAQAKAALLAKLKPRPTVTDPQFDEREAMRAAELKAVRAARKARREPKRKGAAGSLQPPHPGLDVKSEA